MKTLLTLALTLSLISCGVTASSERQLPTVDYVDIPSYVGKWYALLALPQFFTRNCRAQTADYGILNETTISVLNTCVKTKGKDTTITGQAVVKNLQTNSELIVTFNNFFTRLFRVKGDYNIIALDNYQYVMIGSNDRKSLWIMSRNTEIENSVLEKYLKLAQSLGFDTDALVQSQF
jgi:apolipoprotein D and lipocalin family protein